MALPSRSYWGPVQLQDHAHHIGLFIHSVSLDHYNRRVDLEVIPAIGYKMPLGEAFRHFQHLCQAGAPLVLVTEAEARELDDFRAAKRSAKESEEAQIKRMMRL